MNIAVIHSQQNMLSCDDHILIHLRIGASTHFAGTVLQVSRDTLLGPQHDTADLTDDYSRNVVVAT